MANKSGDQTTADAALNIVTSLQEFSSCRIISISELDKDLKTARNDFKRFQNISASIFDAGNATEIEIARLRKQSQEIGSDLDILEESLQAAKQSFAKMVAYFGESSNSASTETLFGVLDDFLIDLTKAKKKYQTACNNAKRSKR